MLQINHVSSVKQDIVDKHIDIWKHCIIANHNLIYQTFCILSVV